MGAYLVLNTVLLIDVWGLEDSELLYTSGQSNTAGGVISIMHYGMVRATFTLAFIATWFYAYMLALK